MLKKITLVLAVLLAALILFAATRPDTFRVQRTVSIKAPPEKIFPHINDLHDWSLWSPFETLDPGMKKTFTGAANGRGAVYEWAGDNKSGTGRMEIIEVAPPSEVKIKLDFLKPFEGHNTAEFTLDRQGDATNVTWAMYGPSAFIHKLLGVFISMDRIVGPQFEMGLMNLKGIVESGK